VTICALADGAQSLARVDAPIPVKKSSGGQPLAVVGGEGAESVNLNEAPLRGIY